MTGGRVYKILFLNQGELFEVYAEGVSQGSLFGFIEVEGLLFGERSQVVVDPSEERLKSEFKGVKRVFLPLHCVLRIDEVEKQGVPRITKSEKGAGAVASFPGTVFPHRPSRDDSGRS